MHTHMLRALCDREVSSQTQCSHSLTHQYLNDNVQYMLGEKLTESCHVTLLESIARYYFWSIEQSMSYPTDSKHINLARVMFYHTDIISGGGDIDCSTTSRENLFISDCPSCCPPTISTLLWLFLQQVTSRQTSLSIICSSSKSQIYLSQLCLLFTQS